MCCVALETLSQPSGAGARDIEIQDQLLNTPKRTTTREPRDDANEERWKGKRGMKVKRSIGMMDDV